jgi:hypothetical protein
MSVLPESAADSSGPRALQDPALPQVFGRYLLVQRLSRGGMGEIFLAKHGLPGFEKLAVIKKVLPNFAEDKQFISRFVDEAQVAIKLQHVNIAQVFEVGRVGDEYFLALEHVEGRDLRRTLTKLEKAQRRVPVDLALYIGRELANGLSYAHRRADAAGKSIGLVHCDISPPNVLVSFEGETKIIDFGIARSALRATASDPKMGFGKFGYMAPEQLIRGGVVDHRTDIYAAGVVVYELLTGQRLYDATNPDYRALARMVAKGEHKLPSHVDPALAPYDDLIAKALRPKQDDRYQTAAELRDAIQTALVAVNPTLSSDQLGAFLRDVFVDEMATQREINDRVARTHIADFQAELQTQAIETITFALNAGAPLGADGAPVPSRPRHPTGALGSVPPVSAPAVATGTPSLGDGTGATELADGDLDDPMTATIPGNSRAVPSLIPSLASPRTATPAPAELAADPRRRSPPLWLWVITGAAVIAAVAAAAVIMTRDDGTPAARRQPSTISVAPAPELTPAPGSAAAPAATGGSDDVAEIEMAPVDVDTTEPDTSRTKPARDRDRVKDRTEPAKAGRDPAKPAADATPPAPDNQAQTVRQKFAAVSREYREFKQKFGGRVDNEWADVAAAVQYAKSPDQWRAVDRKLDSLRSKMKAP